MMRMRDSESTKVKTGKDGTGTRITVTLPPADYDMVCRMAKGKKVSASWIVRDAVEKYLAAYAPLLAGDRRVQ